MNRYKLIGSRSECLNVASPKTPFTLAEPDIDAFGLEDKISSSDVADESVPVCDGVIGWGKLVGAWVGVSGA